MMQHSPPAIAIIGMACVYPGAHTPNELWLNILAGRRFFRRSPAERLPMADYFDPDQSAPGKTYCDQMAIITDWVFDPLEFKVPPVTVETSDLTHWLALYTASEAFKDAQLDFDTLDRTRVEVVLGNTLAGEFTRSHALNLRWPYVERAISRAWGDHGHDPRQLDEILATVKHYYGSPLPEITEDSLAGSMSNTIAGRICNYFDLGGGGYVVDGACSSSLLAVLTACNHLLGAEIDLALVGGVDISLDPFEIVGFAKTQALASDDIRPYDARAAGFLPGEGCGMVVLAREEDARAAGYRIYALIRGWGYSSDGIGGITAPKAEGQVRALSRAYQRAGYPISSVDLIEGHGTGTALGDKIEITALLRTLEDAPEDQFCRIGSIKGNIGHCKAAAGIAGLIKTVMALNRKILPPTVNCVHPNPVFGRPLGRLRPNVRGEAWTSDHKPRRASVSAMGFGGSNCHITLEESNPRDLPSEDELALLTSSQMSELILLSAESRQNLANRIANLIPISDRICRAELTDLAAALSQTDQTGSVRLAIVAKSPWHLADSLRHVSRHLSAGVPVNAITELRAGIFAGIPQEAPELVALFPGQGSQRLNMGQDILRRYSAVRELYEQVEDDVSEILPGGLRSRIERPIDTVDQATCEGWEAELRNARVSQPAIVLSSLTMLQVLEFLGLKPSVSIGNSLGEITALCAAGAYDVRTAVRIAALRGSVTASLDVKDPGAMAALSIPAPEVEELIRPFGVQLVISNYNGPRQTVVSGATHSIKELLHICDIRRIPCQQLSVSHAFHSEILAPAEIAFREILSNVPFEAVTEPVISTLTGQRIDKKTDLRALLSEHFRRPVRFTEAVLKAYERQPALWVEIGPGSVLTSLVNSILPAEKIRCFPTDLKGKDCFHLINNILAQAYVLGFPVAVKKLFEYRFYQPFDLENYAPVFIVNPCERPVQPFSQSANADSHAEGTDSSSLQPKSIHSEEATEIAPDDMEALLDYAIDWIVRRTGFPQEYITAETKLRDDLNFDSIKGSQLVLQLSQKMRRKLPKDPLALTNATLGQVVNAVGHSDFVELHLTEHSMSSDSLQPWVHTFRMIKSNAPLENSAALPLPNSGSAVIVAEPGCPRAHALSKCLQNRGLVTFITEASSLFWHRKVLDTLTVMVVILPQVEQPFYDCAPHQFDDRIEGLATTLFLAFGWPVHWRYAELRDLRCLVLRATGRCEDFGLDLNAGAAFLRSLKLEHPHASLKWINLPEEWSPEQCAEVSMAELGTYDDRVVFEYDIGGLRTTRVAAILDDVVEYIPHLTATDVFLITGGAKGITFELARGLARQTGVKLALVGLSEMPEAGSSNTDNEILLNLEKLEGEGIPHLYVQCDVTDLRAVRQAVAQVERELGTVTGILHGAGINYVRPFREMDLFNYMKCIRVKANGLYNLLACVPLDHLKALHVISSVLGKTGMRSQASYALANAWLDGALDSIRREYPALHCLSLGYSVWSETGMGSKLVMLFDLLLAAGVAPINVEDGVTAYLDLVNSEQPDSTFVITGRLTPDLEAVLFPNLNTNSRYFERVMRFVPGVEIVTEASLSHKSDPYLAEHVFEGTPIFPGVMAIEVMVEAAMVCIGTKDLPVLRDIRFRHPLIISEGATVIIRTLASVARVSNGIVHVQVAMRSEYDGFKENHYEVSCIFGPVAPTRTDPPLCPQYSEPLPKDPEDFCPVPLFQGKFFRRIVAVYRLEPEVESLTKIQIPCGVRYFNTQHRQMPVTGSPIARDAFLQSGAIGLPPRYLPEHVDEIRFHQSLVPGSEVICHCQVVSKSMGTFVAQIAVYTLDGQLAETMNGIRLCTPKRLSGVNTVQVSRPIPCNQVESDLQQFLSIPHAMSIEQHTEKVETPASPTKEQALVLHHLGDVKPARKQVEDANLRAVRQAVITFVQKHRNHELSPRDVSIQNQLDGKPELQFAASCTPEVFQGIDVSLTDGAGLSVALVGPPPVGVDIEPVESRDVETWRGLLGDDGYALALRLAVEVVGPFDHVATRVWTMIEAGKKANSLKRFVPTFESQLDGPWISLVGQGEIGPLRFLSTAISYSDSWMDQAVILTIVTGLNQV